MYLVCLLTVSLAYLTGFGVVSVAGRSLESRVRTTQIEGDKVKGPRLGNVLANIAKLYNVPIAFESEVLPVAEASDDGQGESPIESEHENIPINATLLDSLDNLLKRDSVYRWKIDKEIIVICPARNRSRELDEILAVRIRDRKLSFGDGPTSLGFEILNTDEVKHAIRRNGVENFLLPKDSKDSPRFEILTKDMTVREVLNFAITKGTLRFWMASFAERTNPQIKLVNIITQ